MLFISNISFFSQKYQSLCWFCPVLCWFSPDFLCCYLFSVGNVDFLPSFICLSPLWGHWAFLGLNLEFYLLGFEFSRFGSSYCFGVITLGFRFCVFLCSLLVWISLLVWGFFYSYLNTPVHSVPSCTFWCSPLSLFPSLCRVGETVWLVSLFFRLLLVSLLFLVLSFFFSGFPKTL